MVLSDNEIKKYVQENKLSIEPLEDGMLQPSSVDLIIGDNIWQVAGMPNLASGFSFNKFISNYALNHFHVDVIEPTLLVGGIYLVELKTKIRFSPGTWGYINPKSSAGRIDLYCVVLADGSTDFNTIPPGYQGSLYMLMVPQSFPVRAFTGQSLAQVRIYDGARVYLTKAELLELHRSHGLVDNENLEPVITEDGMYLHLDLRTKPYDFVAVRGGKPISLSSRYEIDPKAYFREKPTDSEGNLFLEPGEFLLAATLEKLRVPPNMCAEMAPYRQEHGELRSHYAGFFDPGWGCGANKEIPGSNIVCEIRNIGTVPIFLSHGQIIATVKFERLPQQVSTVYGEKGLNTNYQGQQGIKLAKFFKPWDSTQ